MIFYVNLNGLMPARYSHTPFPRIKLAARKPTIAQAHEALCKTYGIDPSAIPVDAISDVSPVKNEPVKNWSREALCIPGKLSDGTVYYYMPGETAVVSIVRNDPNNGDEPLVDLVTLPRQLTETDNPQESIRCFFGHVLHHFFTYDRRAKTILPSDPSLLTWDHFFNLPEDYLKTRYSVEIHPVESMLSLDLNRDETPPVA